MVEENKEDFEEEVEHECDYDDDGFCPICETFYEPDDFSGATSGDR